MSAPTPRIESADRLSVQEASARRRGDPYGVGCVAGHRRARGWLDDPRRGDPASGGTLSAHVLALAANLARASSSLQRDKARGEIVGFCYALECPSHAAACQAAAAMRGKHKGGAQ
jgi:hypothetical protein